MRHAIRRQRLAWAAVSLAMATAAAGCSQVAPTQASGPAVNQVSDSGFKTQQFLLDPVLSGLALVAPGTIAQTAPLAMALWGRPYAAGNGYPLVLPHSSLWVGSGIELLTGTWPYRSVLYSGI